MKILSLVFLILFLLVVGPFIMVWGINELLEQAGVANQLPYNFWTWLAAICVGGGVRGYVRTNG